MDEAFILITIQAIGVEDLNKFYKSELMTRSVFIFTPYVRTWTLNLNLSDELVEEKSLNIFLLAKLCNYLHNYGQRNIFK